MKVTLAEKTMDMLFMDFQSVEVYYLFPFGPGATRLMTCGHKRSFFTNN